jgi:hypothetical protein
MLTRIFCRNTTYQAHQSIQSASEGGRASTDSYKSLCDGFSDDAACYIALLLLFYEVNIVPPFERS